MSVNVNNLSINDFSRICRVCLSTDKLQPLYDNNGDSNNITVKMLHAVTLLPFDIHDFLPKQICSVCIKHLYQAYSFSSHCQMIDAALRECLARYHSNLNIKQEILDISECPIENIEIDILPEIKNEETKSKPPEIKNQPTIETVFVKTEPLDLEPETESVKFHCENAQMATSCNISRKKVEIIPNFSPGFSNIGIPAPDSNSNSSTSQEDLAQNQNNNALVSQQYACELCSRSFSNTRNLNRHKLLHAGHRPHACNICKKSFSEKQSLVIHQRIHTGEKPFACDLCGKRFSILSNMKNHRRIHFGDRRYECDICQKRFSQSIHLITHRGTHTGEQLYKCDACTKSFARLDRLNKHKNTVHLIVKSEKKT